MENAEMDQSREVRVKHLFNNRDGPEQAALYMVQMRECMHREHAAAFLHPGEWEFFGTLKFERRIHSYLAGRYAAKKAISLLTGERDLRSIRIERGCFNQPVVIGWANVQVSITHAGNAAGAIAFHEAVPMGIDIERVSVSAMEVLMNQTSPRELELMQSIPHSLEHMLTLSWSVKEALSKVLRTGLTLPTELLELNRLEVCDGYVISKFANFMQYEAVSTFMGSDVCSIVYPKRRPPDLGVLRHAVEQAYQYS